MRTETLVKAIEAGERVERHYEEGAGFGRSLAEALVAAGWRHAENLSTCRKATYEAYLAKGSRRVEITSAVFLGPFTLVEVH